MVEKQIIEEISEEEEYEEAEKYVDFKDVGKRITKEDGGRRY